MNHRFNTRYTAALLCMCIALIGFFTFTANNADARRGKPTSEQIINAIHQVESNGAVTNVPPGDGGKAIGPFQTHYITWLDATHNPIYNRAGKVVAWKRIHPGDYADCKGYAYSKQVLIWQMDNYAPNGLNNGDYETVARVWNGGPAGPSKPSTLAYVRRVEEHLPNI